MNSRKDFKIKPIPDSIKQRVVEVKFKLDDGDMAKNVEDSFKVDDQLVVIHLSKASYHNGLIMGDRILKMAGLPAKKNNIYAALKMGEEKFEISRREYITPVNAERLNNMKFAIRPGYSYFVVTAIKPASAPVNSPMGMTIKAVKNRALLTAIEPNSITSIYFALGDTIIDFNGATIPFADTTFIRDEISKFHKVGRLNVLVERPVTTATVNELRRYLLSVLPTESDVEVAQDVKAIGLEASNMHSVIFKKLKPPSILSADVRKNQRKNAKAANLTVEEERNIKISMASTEMRINSDVEDMEDLKDVVKKSHAASAVSGFFDDE